MRRSIRRHATKRGWATAPVRQSAEARLHSKMLHGFCKAGVLITAKMITKLLRNAKIQLGTFITAAITSFSCETVSFSGTRIHEGKPQKLVLKLLTISSCHEWLPCSTRDRKQPPFYLNVKRNLNELQFPTTKNGHNTTRNSDDTTHRPIALRVERETTVPLNQVVIRFGSVASE